MIEVILNAIKVITSEDARKSAASLLNAIVRSPEWQKDVCFLVAKVSPIYREQCVLLADITAKKMSNLGYPENKISAFKNSFNELVRNAFEHGCKSGVDKVTINLDIAESYVSLAVTNPRRKFDPLTIVRRNKEQLEQNPYHMRGRGLIIIAQNADSFEPFNKGRGVKVVFYKYAAEFIVHTFGDKDLNVIEIRGDIYTPSFMETLLAAIDKIATNLILFFSSPEQLEVIVPLTLKRRASRERRYRGDIHSSDGTRILLESNQLFMSKGKKVVALLSRRGYDTEGTLPDALVAYSWEEALRKISLVQSFTPAIRRRVKSIVEKDK